MAPRGWKAVSFGKLFDIRSGIGFKYSEYRESGIPLIKIDNVSHGYIKWSNKSYLPISYLDEYPELVLTEGDILLALNRPITQGMLKIARVKQIDIPSILYQRVGKIIFKDPNANADFYYYLFDKEIFNFVYSKSLGSDQPFISTTELKKLCIYQPPLPEQIKIAKILSTWDKAIETTEQLLNNSQQQKKALMQQLLTGKKRFPEFDKDWKSTSFDKLFISANDKKVQVKSSDYLSSGKIPIVDQGQDLIAGFTNNSTVYSNIPIIIFGDHTRVIKWVDFTFAPGADGTQLLKTKDCIDLKFGYYLILNANIQNLGYSRHMRELKEKSFKFPPDSCEQQKIASTLTNIDHEIENLQQQLIQLKLEKKALMQQLLTGKRRVKIDKEEAAYA